MLSAPSAHLAYVSARIGDEPIAEGHRRADPPSFQTEASILGEHERAQPFAVLDLYEIAINLDARRL